MPWLPSGKNAGDDAHLAWTGPREACSRLFLDPAHTQGSVLGARDRTKILERAVSCVCARHLCSAAGSTHPHGQLVELL
ncbi:hypothetical protein PsYK624_040440 [Phanerochaete sordida]|uniref:Uncharacterized protein n=1 Tax=Phanerochaete sordida TaxID=48140 RepID=A0A9P3G492_9APHY|nr:hypothetical protein PsYK624_040440 [Phanerochaete sordida]